MFTKQFSPDQLRTPKVLATAKEPIDRSSMATKLVDQILHDLDVIADAAIRHGHALCEEHNVSWTRKGESSPIGIRGDFWGFKLVGDLVNVGTLVTPVFEALRAYFHTIQYARPHITEYPMEGPPKAGEMVFTTPMGVYLLIFFVDEADSCFVYKRG